MAKVVPIRGGGEIVPPGTPDPECIKVAQELLRMALSGEMRGLCVAVHHADDSQSRVIAGYTSLATVGNAYRLVAALEREF